jgi:hypothetical protein
MVWSVLITLVCACALIIVAGLHSDIPADGDTVDGAAAEPRIRRPWPGEFDYRRRPVGRRRTGGQQYRRYSR